MGKDTLSNLLLLFAGMNAVAGVAAAKLDLTYLAAGLGTAVLLFGIRHAILLRER